MDPHVVFDCEKVLPNRFALTLAVAARGRALNRGAEPRLDRGKASMVDLALQEIAAGLLTRDELAPFLPVQDAKQSLPQPDPVPRLGGDSRETAAAAPASHARETVH